MIKLVGTTLQTDAVETDVPCIGFCNWKRISATNHGKPNNNQRPIQHDQINITSIDDCELESNHTHFVLFDHEIDNVENIQLKRGEIERQLSKTLLENKTINDDNHSKSVFRNTVPIVTLLLGGNFTTLNVICEGLKNETPVVAVLGAGHLADIVATLCLDLRTYDELIQIQRNDHSNLKDKLEERQKKDVQECKNRLQRLWLLEGENTDQINGKIDEYVKILIDMNTLIAVYDGVKCIDNLEDVVADVMWNEISYQRKNRKALNDGYDPKAEELKWCLIWNKEARGELEIWINSGDENMALTETKRRWISKLGQSALFEALCRNKVSFVSLLMDNGASIEAFEIHDMQIICKKTLVKKYRIGKNRMKQEGVVWNHNPKHHWKTTTDTLFHENKTETLYLWFLFMNRPDMAKCLCSTIPNQTMATLLAATIYFKAAENDNENKRTLIDIGKQFDGHSKNLIDECFVQDKSLAINVLECKAPALFHCMPLDVARRTDCRGFLASDTVQAFVVQKWIFMALDLILWSFRLLHLFTAYEILGPKLVMIYKMMKDAVLIFAFFILILLFAFSVTCWSLLTTNNQVNWTYAEDGSLFNVTVVNRGSDLWTWQLLRDVSNWGILKVFGQTDEPYNGAVSGNDVYGTFVYLLAIAFVFISSILLVNVLIAMFK
ncbi:unnamed protein product [Adineta steineri]|uniref:Uncharacterized protein n=1 Tax=Adineta steineri TaxID=433720 RepID=A0A819B4U9_9BILA|nr:unnamed protein product [Adineta steineri]